jgi:hypothetical protein
MPQKGESGRDLIQIGRDNVKNFLEVNFHSKNKKIFSELEYYLEHWHQFDGEQQVDIFNSSFNKYCKRMNKLESFDNNFWWLTFFIVFLISGMLSVLVPSIERSLIWRKTFGTVETILNTTFTVTSVVNATAYTITTSVAANASDTGKGGATVKIEYEYPVGLDVAVAGLKGLVVAPPALCNRDTPLSLIVRMTS